MDPLPQTAPGVPAAVIDYTTEELQQIDVAGIFSWLSSGERVRTTLIRVLTAAHSASVSWRLVADHDPRSKHSVPILLWKSATSHWRDASHVYAWASLRRTRQTPLYKSFVENWDLMDSQPSRASNSRSSWAQH